LNDYFLDNKYTKWYFSSLVKAQRQEQARIESGGYFEKHHIIPTSIGGKNTRENKVFLSPKEHYIFHHLLTKMMKTAEHKVKMIQAFWQLSHGAKRKGIRLAPRQHDWARRQFAATQSEFMMRSCPFRGHKHTERAKEQNSLKMKGNKNAVGNKSRSGDKWSEAAKKAKSIAMKAMWAANKEKNTKD